MVVVFSKIKKISWKIAEHYYSIFLILVILGFLWGGFLFYENFILIRKAEPIVISPQVQIKKNVLEEVLREIENKERNLERIESKTYFNLFGGMVSIGEEG